MGVVAPFFEPHSCNFGKLYIFLRCLNDISTIFWNSSKRQTCQKCQEQMCPDNTEVRGWALYCLNTQIRHISFKKSNIELSETSSHSGIQNWYSPMRALYRNQSHAYLWEKGNHHEILMSILDQWITLYRNQNTQLGLRIKK